MAAVLASLAIALLLLVFASTAAVRHHGAAAVPAPVQPPPDWTEVSKPLHVFELDAPLLHAVPLVYAASRRTDGNGREDIMAFGTGVGDAPLLRLRLYRRGASQAALTPLFAAIALQAADAGLSIERSGLADIMASRFGSFEVADVELARGSAARLPCSGFRLALERPAFTITGLACGASGSPLTHAELACLIDRLDLAAGGDDRDMIDFFAASETRRNPSCGGAKLAPETLHAAWLDDKPVTHGKTSRRH